MLHEFVSSNDVNQLASTLEVDCQIRDDSDETVSQSSNLQKETIDSKNSVDTGQQTLKQKKRKKRKPKKKSAANCSKLNDGVQNRVNHKEPKERKNSFPPYIPIAELDKILQQQDPSDMQYVEGYLHIYPQYKMYSFVKLLNNEKDLLIVGIRKRNRALNGDYVIVHIDPPENWRLYKGQVQKTGYVVNIRKRIHSRKAVGCLKLNGTSTIFCPRDELIPQFEISQESLQQFAPNIDNYNNTLYLGTLIDWVNPSYAFGKVDKIIGSKDDIEVESNALLLEYNLDVTPYDCDLIKGVPDDDYTITEDDLNNREDWRDECVFTIDPETAVDLDDAVSCKLLENNNYEIGVHIADVTHYLEFMSPLDIQVSKRATSVYMTDNVYHMLPEQLCRVCSLLPGKDRLAFSVIWEMTPDAEVVGHRFAKTVIRSCCQMAYPQAQSFIENTNEYESNHLGITENFTVDDLAEKVKILHSLSVQMRNKRFERGALQINQPKLYVTLDRITRLPVSFSIKELKDSNRLIEEFMLLANMTVAKHLYDTIPDFALLRNHIKPAQHVLSTINETLQSIAINLDFLSAGTLHASIKKFEDMMNEFSSKTEKDSKMMIINNLCCRAMERATYICSSTVDTEEDLKHYALNVTHYTHFTSPIRRYADCVVHRLLYSTMLNARLSGEWMKKWCKEVAANCNLKKYNAKMVQTRSSELYFTYLLSLNGPMNTTGVVLNITDKFIDVILSHIGIKLKVPYPDLKNLKDFQYFSGKFPYVHIRWKTSHTIGGDQFQEICFSVLLDLRIEKHPDSFELIGTLLPPS